MEEEIYSIEEEELLEEDDLSVNRPQEEAIANHQHSQKPVAKKASPPPLPRSSLSEPQRDALAPVVTTQRVARVTPSNPLELPKIHDGTIYACITSDALKHVGRQARYAVPEGFIGLLSDSEGNMQSSLLSGEEAEGRFHLHLFRQGTQLMSQHLHGLTSADGYSVNASLTYGFRFPDGDAKSLQDFILAHVLGRTAFSGALLNSDIERESRKAIADVAATLNAEELVSNPQREVFEERFLDALRSRLSSSGIVIRGLDGLGFNSHDLKETQKKDAKRERKAQEDKKREEVKAVIAREKIGAELSRQELSSVLDSVRQKRELGKMEHEHERLQREKALETLEKEYRAEQFNLDSAMRKTLAQTDLEIDRLKFEEYLRMTGEVRERLQEDRIEFYINQIQDESLKARLLLRLMEKDMTPEQLSELAELEKARAMSAARLIASPAPDATEQAEEEGEETKEETTRPSFKMAFVQQAAAPPSFTAGVQSTNQTIEVQAEAPSVVLPPPLKKTHEAPSTSTLPKRAEVTTFLVTAGRTILAVDVGGGTSALREFADFGDGPLGSLRSLVLDTSTPEAFILAGARRGVYRVSMATGKVTQYPIDSGIAPQTGVNSVLAYQGSFYATHSQFGLLRWAHTAVNYPATRVARELTRNSQTVRALFLDQGRWPTFACGNRVVAIEHDVVSRPAAVYSGAPAEILAISSSDEAFTAICRSGQLVQWQKNQPLKAKPLLNVGGRVFSASIAADGFSMILGMRDRHVRVLNTKTQMISRYDAPRDIVAAREFGRVIAGISKDRSRLFFWDSFGDGHPFSEVEISDPPYDFVML